jgi:PhnB protein
MAIINPYVNFMGNTEEAFNFYRSVFGGEFSQVVRFSDTPVAAQVPEAEKHLLMHIALPIGKSNVLMGTDALESMGHKVTFGTAYSVSVHAESREEADRIFNGLSEGAKVDTPIQDMFWGSYWGNLTDKFGLQWMVSYDAPRQS